MVRSGQVDKSLVYNRAAWDPEGGGPLQQALDAAHKACPNTKDRTFTYSTGSLQGLQKTTQNGRLLLHIAQYTLQRPTSLVPLPAPVPRGRTAIHPPPNDNSFMEGDIAILVSGDHVILCVNRTREAAAHYYFQALLDRADLITTFGTPKMVKVANIDTVRLLHREGVKKIRLGASFYEASMLYEQRTTLKKSILSHVAEDILSVFTRDALEDLSLAEIQARESLNVRVEISFDGRKKYGEIAQGQIQEVAEQIVDEHDEGFVILTGDDQKITPKEVRLRKKISVTEKGNSFDVDEVWREMHTYLNELKSSGALSL